MDLFLTYFSTIFEGGTCSVSSGRMFRPTYFLYDHFTLPPNRIIHTNATVPHSNRPRASARVVPPLPLPCTTVLPIANPKRASYMPEFGSDPRAAEWTPSFATSGSGVEVEDRTQISLNRTAPETTICYRLAPANQSIAIDKDLSPNAP